MNYEDRYKNIRACFELEEQGGPYSGDTVMAVDKPGLLKLIQCFAEEDWDAGYDQATDDAVVRHIKTHNPHSL